MDEDDVARARARLDAEQRFIDERGGGRWIETFVKPYYLKWMGYGAATRTDAQPLIPAVRGRAGDLTAADISVMVGMQWRIQVMGTWYAIARNDKAFTASVHSAFEVCYGSLTSPALTVAVLTYPNQATADVLHAYRERATTREHGDTGFISAALRRLEANPRSPDRTDHDEVLDRLLDVAHQLQVT